MTEYWQPIKRQIAALERSPGEQLLARIANHLQHGKDLEESDLEIFVQAVDAMLAATGKDASKRLLESLEIRHRPGPQASAALTEQRMAYAARIIQAERDGQDRKLAIRELAGELGCSPRTIENYLTDHEIDVTELINFIEQQHGK